ncbi:MAG: Hpt domain-containing protein, partial [Nocardioides sp.]
SGASSAPSPAATEQASGVVDPELVVIDEDRRQLLAELVKDGESFFDRTARSFVGRIDGQVRDIRSAHRKGSAHETFTSSHLVKGSALNLGLPRVSAAAAAIEAQAHTGSLSGVQEMLDELDREVATAVTELRRRMR